ncbi:LytR/AlgR family response regulator transcription factor [Paraclostridium sordellii]|uniref:LytR/AlgR family response regulator transcription factor n=1 Tax=Paraclostridium sordellii TaxID=1505 RepID=UPI0005E3D9E7|nr:LytTR family DNA-binding domain-containing protein [Paeniclostridium sordellii]CEN23616.1 LytR family DNA-binding response regulator [[Clostridium] sordellii] [Paeniclostridium sordellii]
MVLSIVICDDEEIYRNTLTNYLDYMLEKGSYKITEFSNGETLINKYPSKADILLLDVQMDGINGLDAARKIREIDTQVSIIFTTAFSDFMQKGYEVRAFRYLLKPISYDEFSNNLEECLKEVKERSENFITIKDLDSGEFKRIPVNSILYVETDLRNILIHTDDDIYRSNISINKLEKELKDKAFFRCHRSYLINLNKVRGIKQSTVKIKNDELLVSRYKIKELKLRITEGLGELL